MGTKVGVKWPNKITSSLVEQLIKAEKHLTKAMVVFDSATAEYNNGFRHDESTFGLMVSKLVSANQFKSAEDLLNRMKEENCMITESIFLSICRGYGRVHKPLESIRIFQKMKDYECKPTDKSYITIFAILVGENQLKMALRFYKYMREVGIPPSVTSLNVLIKALYKYMREVGIPPSVTSLNVLIKALCKNNGTMDAALRIFKEMPNRGCVPDSYTYGTLINAFCRYGKIDEAKDLFKEMDVKGCSPSVVTYTSLIRGLCQANDLDGATKLLEEMSGKGIEPNVFTYTSLMDGLCKSGLCSKAMELLKIMISERQKPNIITYSTLLHGLCKEGKIREAVEILDRMKLQGLKPDAGLYSKVINSLCDANKFQEAANFLDEMVLDGISPNRLTWSLHVRIHNLVIQGLLSENDLNRAFRIYLSMRSRGISVEVKSFESLISCYSKKEDLHKVNRVFYEMVVDGCVPDEDMWRAMVNGFSNWEKAKEATELVESEVTSELCCG